MSRRRALAGALAAATAVLVGCAVLAQPRPLRALFDSPPQAEAGPNEPQLLDDGYRDIAGAVHVHTSPYSHDAHGTFSDVVLTANAQQLDYVIITEHNNLQALRDGLQGWHGATLVLIGVELSTQGGHYVALNVREEIDKNRLTTQQVIDEVARQGGFGFIAHPYFTKHPWTDWSVHGMTGIEAFNVAHDTMDAHKPELALWTIMSPVEPFYLSILDRPYDPLATWDELIRRHGPMVGLGAIDAHEFHALGVTFAPYAIMFRLVRTHLLLPELPPTEAAIYDALRKGHAYLGLELVADARGARFFAHDGARVLGVMGDQVPFREGLALSVALPQPGTIRLFRDGRPMATMRGMRWDIPVTDAGVYRIEVEHDGKPWIISNPIYVTPGQPADAPAP